MTGTEHITARRCSVGLACDSYSHISPARSTHAANEVITTFSVLLAHPFRGFPILMPPTTCYRAPCDRATREHTAIAHRWPNAPHAPDPVERVSARPDLAILIYPVITLDGPYAHAGSRSQLLGSTPSEDLVRLLSIDRQVSPATPPTFLVHGSADTSVPCENSLLLAAALSQARVPFELHLYEGGQHGFGMRPTAPGVSAWTERCAEWLQARGFLDR